MARCSLHTSDLDYELPEGRIATRPAEPRDSARLLVIRRSRDRIEHRHVRDLPEYLRPGDALVFNTTAVLPARLIGRRLQTGGKVEGLFLHEAPSVNGSLHWRVMFRTSRRLKIGQRIDLLDRDEQSSGLSLELLDKAEGEWLARVDGEKATAAALEAVGRTPLPPYIRRARGAQSIADELDRRWYQTVYADAQQRHSVAAPTAGLHFTPELLARIDSLGVRRIDVTLHVGLGTFQPIGVERLDHHRMHSESFEVSHETICALRSIRDSGGGRVIAVGTTSVRALESLPEPLPDGQICGPYSGLTDLMIAPPYEFRCVDGMLTNFHLPKSTLLALVAAMVGLDRIKAVYREAIDRGYRFYSYGDAMLILP